MDMTKLRGRLYALGTVGALGIVATIAAAFGWIEYDPATRLVTIPPFTIDALVGLIPGVATIFAAPLAWVAVRMGWGPKK